jgi:hypothetical protein
VDPDDPRARYDLDTSELPCLRRRQLAPRPNPVVKPTGLPNVFDRSVIRLTLGSILIYVIVRSANYLGQRSGPAVGHWARSADALDGAGIGNRHTRDARTRSAIVEFGAFGFAAFEIGV